MDMISVAIATSTVCFQIEQALTALRHLPSQRILENSDQISRIFNIATGYVGIFLEFARALRDHFVVTELRSDEGLLNRLESLCLVLSPFLKSVEIAKDTIAESLAAMKMMEHYDPDALKGNSFNELLQPTKEVINRAFDVESGLTLITL